MAAQGLPDHGDQFLPVRRSNAASGAGVNCRSNDTPAGGQRLGGEESGAAVAHGQQGLAVHGGVEPEAEQIGFSLAEEALDPDVVMNGLAGTRQSAVKGNDCIQQAVHRQPPGDEIDSQVAGEEQVGLARFHGDAGRYAAAIQVPGIGVDIMLGHDPARGHGFCFAFKGHDPVHQHERFIGQAHPGRKGVGLGKCRAQHTAHAAPGKFKAHFTVKGAGFGQRCSGG